MYTIKSVSKEGTYYLVNHWNRAKSFWLLGSEIKVEDMFLRAQDAKRSLTMLLKVMPEYKEDVFSLVQTDQENRIIAEEALQWP